MTHHHGNCTAQNKISRDCTVFLRWWLCRFHNNQLYNKAYVLSQCFGYKSSHTLICPTGLQFPWYIILQASPKEPGTIMVRIFMRRKPTNSWLHTTLHKSEVKHVVMVLVSTLTSMFDHQYDTSPWKLYCSKWDLRGLYSFLKWCHQCILYLVARYFSVFLGSQLGVESWGGGGWSPVCCILCKELQLVVQLGLLGGEKKNERPGRNYTCFLCL